MEIDRNSHVTFEYVLRNENRELIESSRTDDPPTYIHGYRQIIAGLERRMAGRKMNDRFSVTVPPEEGYGLRDEGLAVNVPLSEIPPEVALYEGASFDAVNEQGHEIRLYIKEITDEEVVLDANHPMAGMTIHYDITIKDVRHATEEELMEAAAPVFGLDDLEIN